MPEERYILTLTRDQANMIKDACELMARLRIGQFDHITEKLLDVAVVDDYCRRRESANAFLTSAACALLGTTIHGTPDGKKDQLHHRAWNIYATIRYCMAWHDTPEGGWSVCFDKPRPWGGESVPDCRVVDGDKSDNTEDARDLLKSVLLHSGSLCMYCKHYLPCRRNACPHFKEQVGYDEKLPDGSIKHHPHYSRRLCEGRDGVCDAKIGTPCDRCVQGSGWDFSLSVDQEDRLNPM